MARNGSSLRAISSKPAAPAVGFSLCRVQVAPTHGARYAGPAMAFRCLTWVAAWLAVTSFALVTGCGGAESASRVNEGAGGSVVITGAGGETSSTESSSAQSVASSASASVGASSGGSEATCPAAGPFAGQPITAPEGAWTWIPIDGAKCRDGSPTGIGVRLEPGATKAFIYLEGGGACFNGSTCAVSLASFGAPAFAAWAGTVGLTGIFDPQTADNPVKGWSAVYVPYCSGDVHAGSASNVSVAGALGDQQFVGYENVGAILQRLVPTFKEADQVLLTGISAGGFGAALNYDRVASAFCPTPVTLLDDSGPPMSDEYLAPCLQKEWRGLWSLDAALPANCSACSQPDGGGIVNYASYLGARWPDAKLGLVSSTHDAVISTFFGFGADQCTAAVPLSGDTYQAGLDDLRDHYLTGKGWGTYYISSVSHTWLLGPGFYTTTVQGKRLSDWVGDLVGGKPSHVGP